MGVTGQVIGTGRLVLALFCAAFVGWFCLVGPMVFRALLSDGIQSALSGLVLLALFGLPIAGAAILLVGVPLAIVARRRRWFSLKSALGLGSLGGFAIWLVLLVLQLLTASGSWGGSEGMLWVEGQPTRLGWVQELYNSVQYVFAGAFVGLAARFIALR